MMDRAPGRRSLDLSSGVTVMGILNVTPDSFSDGGRYASIDQSVVRASEMIGEGADIIDIGGESTGPGSVDVSEELELSRVLPVIGGVLRRSPGAFLSIDTYKSRVAEQALAAGVAMVNDVTAGRVDPRLLEVVAAAGCPYVLMYAKDPMPRTTREPRQYDDVVAHVARFFEERLAAAEHAGIARSRVLLDPGMGAFVSGDPGYSFEVLSRLEELSVFGLPLLVCPGRKSFLAGTDRLPPSERLEGTLAATAIAVIRGASVIRTHDVRATKRCVEIAEAIRQRRRA